MFLYILTTTEYKYNLCQSGTGIFSGVQLLNEWSENVFKGRFFPRILLKANSDCSARITACYHGYKYAIHQWERSLTVGVDICPIQPYSTRILNGKGSLRETPKQALWDGNLSVKCQEFQHNWKDMVDSFRKEKPWTRLTLPGLCKYTFLASPMQDTNVQKTIFGHF